MKDPQIRDLLNPTVDIFMMSVLVFPLGPFVYMVMKHGVGKLFPSTSTIQI